MNANVPDALFRLPDAFLLGLLDYARPVEPPAPWKAAHYGRAVRELRAELGPAWLEAAFTEARRRHDQR
jgi:hypothetical protein